RPFSNIISPPTVPKWFALLASRITTPNSYILRSEFISASATNFKGIMFYELWLAQACESSPKVLFTSTCQHWPSSYRAESIMAILSALIVSPEFANVLLECINNKLADNQSRVLLDTISQISDLWILPQDDSDLTFIDLVKGIVQDLQYYVYRE
ncbi:7312_t:CDS:2, partial [Rhizophagus irregularis]